jgi:hypothetical protein
LSGSFSDLYNSGLPLFTENDSSDLTQVVNPSSLVKKGSFRSTLPKKEETIQDNKEVFLNKNLICFVLILYLQFLGINLFI